MQRIVLLWFFALLSACATPPPVVKTDKLPSQADSQAIVKQTSPVIRVAAVGDVMLGTDYPEDRLAPHDGELLLTAAQPLLQRADIGFANLEGTLLDGGEPRKQCKDVNRCYLFRSPSHYALHFKQAGIDVLSLANNHARDFGEEGREASMQALQLAGLHHSGRLGDIASWVVKQRRIALIAFAPFANANDMLDLPKAHQLVAEVKRQHDIVIVSIHAGAEGENAARLPFANEFYYGEDRGDSVAFAHRMIDAGADLILGHGPHVPRALELYRDRLIAYSLGNFCTYYGIKISGLNGVAPLLWVELDAEGRFLAGQIHSFRQFRPQGTLADPQQEAASLMARLTMEDFPYGGLEIDNRGKIRRSR